jgi:sn-glycerol 3-phosphate transport system ATP-binding protein
MAGLRLEGLRKSFGANEILKGVDLALADGEMLVIVGASGCGKSTLLRLVAGLETPTAGSSTRPRATSPWCSRTTRSIRT